MAKRREKASTSKRFTMQTVDDLLNRAQSGDTRAEERLRSEAAKLAKKVNRQIREFERLGRTSAAYQRAEYYLSTERGTERFRERTKTQDLQQLAEDVEQMLRLSSVEGYSLKTAQDEERQVEKNRGAVRAALGDLPEEDIQFAINEMFLTDAWKEFKKSHGNGTGLIQDAMDAFKQGKTIHDLMDAYNDFKSTTDESFDITEAWERFTGKDWRY